MVGIAHKRGYRLVEEYHDEGKKKRCRAYGLQGRGINFLRVFSVLAHEAEEGSLHSVGKHNDKKCHISIDIGDDTVLSALGVEPCGLNWYEQIVDESCHDTAQTIDSSIFC